MKMHVSMRLLGLRFLLVLVLLQFLVISFLLFEEFTSHSSKHVDERRATRRGKNDGGRPEKGGHEAQQWDASKATHRLAVIVPFRDRFDELLVFVPHMKKYLFSQRIENEIFIVNQVDSHRFNRASLINVGFIVSRDACDYIAMHDVDLLPLNPNLDYSYPVNGPFHVAAPGLHPRYNYTNFIGGILLFANKHFEQVNGLSNRFWGWGREDDELFMRIRDAKLTLFRPRNVTTGRENTFLHLHDREHRKRDTMRYGKQKEMSFWRDTKTGLRNVHYEVVRRREMAVDGYPATIIDVVVQCNKTETPWCDHPSPAQPGTTATKQPVRGGPV